MLTAATRLSRVFLKHAQQPHDFAFEPLISLLFLNMCLAPVSAPVSNILSTEKPFLATHCNGAPCLLAITLTFLIAFFLFFHRIYCHMAYHVFICFVLPISFLEGRHFDLFTDGLLTSRTYTWHIVHFQ